MILTEIKPATIEILDDLSILFDQYRQFYNQPANIAEAKRFLNERMINNESRIFVSIDISGQISGFVQLYPIFSSVSMKRSWLFNDLFVRSEYRKKGIAKQLIERCKQLAEETKANGLLLETSKDNFEGNNLYPSVGFEIQERTNFYFWSNKEN